MATTLIPEQYLNRVIREFSNLPLRQGKVSLTFEISCGTGGVINCFKVKRFTEDEER